LLLPAQVENPTPAGWKKYEDDVLAFAIAENWVCQKVPPPPALWERVCTLASNGHADSASLKIFLRPAMANDNLADFEYSLSHPRPNWEAKKQGQKSESIVVEKGEFTISDSTWLWGLQYGSEQVDRYTSYFYSFQQSQFPGLLRLCLLLLHILQRLYLSNRDHDM